MRPGLVAGLEHHLGVVAELDRDSWSRVIASPVQAQHATIPLHRSKLLKLVATPPLNACFSPLSTDENSVFPSNRTLCI